MGFADAYTAYLQKHAIRGQLVSEAPDLQLNTIIAIPAYNESGLTTCLDSLFHCDPPLAPVEVIVLINSAKSSSREIVEANRQSYEEVREWIGRENNQDSGQHENANRGQDTSQPQEKLRFHVVLVEDLPEKHFGAGLARKLVMDEAVRRLAGRAAGNQLENQLENRPAGPGSMGQKVEEKAEEARGAAPGQSAEEQAGRAARGKVNGIIVSLDADTVVRRDYLRAVEDHFSRHPRASGCSISFEHPLSRQTYAHLFSKPVSQPPSTPDKSSQSHSPSENVSPDDLPKENPTPENFPPENPILQNLPPESLSPENRNPNNLPLKHFPPKVFEAVTNYELHQRYYLLAVRYTGYPYAYHTVGSCFAVQAEAYCRAGGMSRRKAGEDFYFIQKLAMQGGFTECRSTRVYPSPRPSDRVPFGTGPDISRQIGNGQLDASAKHLNDRDSYGTGPDNWQLPPYLTYHPDLFEHLRMFFELIPRLYRSGSAAGNIVTENEVRATGAADAPAKPDGDPGTAADADHMTVKDRGQKEAPENDPPAEPDGDPPLGTEKAAVLDGVPPVLGRYLEESGFWKELEEIRGNTASEGAFRKRFFNKFNMFRILKYLHYAEEHGVEKMEVTAAAGVMLEMWENAQGSGMPDGKGQELESPISSSTREMLLLYRKYFG